MKSLDEVFSGVNMSKKHSDYFLQTMLYSTIVRNDKKVNPTDVAVSPALLFIQHAGADDYDPILKIANKEIKDIREVYDEFMQGLRDVITEIFNPAVPFSPTHNTRSSS